MFCSLLCAAYYGTARFFQIIMHGGGQNAAKYVKKINYYYIKNKNKIKSIKPTRRSISGRSLERLKSKLYWRSGENETSPLLILIEGKKVAHLLFY